MTSLRAVGPPAPARAPKPVLRVWLVDLGTAPGRWDDVERDLTADELARARRGVPAVHRRRVLLRAALRRLLADELHVAAVEVPLTTTEAGRPELPGTGLDLSCAADGTLGVIAVANGLRVGVDVEAVAPWDPAVLSEGWLHPAERRALAALPEEARPAALTGCWTKKEAVLKGLGTGLSGDPAGLRTAVGRSGGRIAGWTLQPVVVPRGRVACVATSPPEGRHPTGWEAGPIRPTFLGWREVAA